MTIRTTLRCTNENYHDVIKNDEKTVKNAMTVELEDDGAVVTVLAYFIYSQCQITEDVGTTAGM